jgi:tetratricopeptide (TPR) repeat protein
VSSDFVSRGQGLVAAGQYQEAVKVCRLGLLGRPAEVGGRIVLGQALLALRRFDEVLAEMRVALDLEPSSAAAFQLRGEALLRKGDVHGAGEALARARSLAPGDPAIAALAAEASRAASAAPRRPLAAPTFGEPADSATKHYPSSFEQETAREPRRNLPPLRSAPTEAEFAERGGSTMEIDPGRDSVQILDDGLASDLGVDDAALDQELAATAAVGPSRGRPVKRGSTVDVGDDDVIDVDAGEVLGRGKAALRGPSVLADDYEDEQATMIDAQPYRRGAEPPPTEPALDEATATTSYVLPPARLPGTAPRPPVDPPRPMPALVPVPVLTRPVVEPPRSADPPRPGVRPGAITAQGPVPPPARPAPPEPARPEPRPEPARPAPADDEAEWDASPPLAADWVGGPDSGEQPRASRDDDMQMIRAGLGLGERTDARRKILPATTAVVPRPVAPAPTDRTTDRGEGTHKVRTDPGGVPLALAPAPRPARPVLILAVWIGLAVAVIGGGVWGGFAIRGVRLSRQIAGANRAAVVAAADDTFAGWQRARDIYAGVVEVRDTAGNRAAVAIARAVLAAEFGHDVAGARTSIAALGTGSEAAVARAYLAVADGDPAAARAAADAARDASPGDGAAPYLVGRAALLSDRWEDAAQAFRGAVRLDSRPLYFLGLAEAEAGRRNWPEAKAACDRALQLRLEHPGAIIARARVLAASGALAQGGDPALVPALERLLAAGSQPGAPPVAAPAESAMAGLALAEVHRARGDAAAARQALDRALAIGSEQRRFAEGAVALLVALGDITGAAKVGEAAVARLPASTGLRVALAEIALLDGDPGKALAALDKAGDLARRPDALAVRGRARLALGELEPAAADLDAALGLAPDLDTALIARGELDLARGDARAAVTRLAPRYQPASPLRLAIAYATALREVGERDQARDVLERILAPGGPAPSAPDQGRAWLEMARIERDSGELRAARAAYARAIELAPAGAEARLEAALLALDSSDPVGAREALDRLVIDRPADGRALVEAARAHTLLGDVPGAIALLDRAEPQASAPRWLIARERGRVALRQRQQKVAIQTLERAVGLMPDDGETRLLLLDAHLAADDGDSARRVLGDLQKRLAGKAEVLLGRGRVEYYDGKNRDARAVFTQARDRLVRDKAVPRRVADALAWLGRVAYEEDDKAAARKLLSKAVALDPSHADAWVYIGFTEEERRRPAAAAAAFEKVTKLDPDNLDNWFNLGKAAADGKQNKLARSALEEYLKRAPKGPLAEDARKLLARL